MKVRKLDENGDIVTRGVIWAYDKEAVAQTVSTRLKLFLGEYFRDITDGVPWFEKEDGTEGILGRGYSLSQVEAILRNRIARTEGVLKLLSFQIDYDETLRKISVRAFVLTVYGSEEISWES